MDIGSKKHHSLIPVAIMICIMSIMKVSIKKESFFSHFEVGPQYWIPEVHQITPLLGVLIYRSEFDADNALDICERVFTGNSPASF